MKILFLTRAITPPWNEASKNFVYELSKSLGGHEIHLLSCLGVKAPSKNVIMDPVFSKSDSSLAVSFKEKIQLLLRVAKNDGVDIYHSFFRPSLFSSYALRLALFLKKRKPKVVQTIVSGFLSDSKLKKVVFADNVIVISKAMRQKLLDLGFKNVKLIRPGIDLEKYSPGDIASAKRKFGLSGKNVVLYAGGFLPEKGYKTFFESAKNVVKTNPNTVFVFACRDWGTKIENDLKDEVIQEVKDLGLEKNFSFFGELQEMLWLQRACDIAVYVPNSMASKFDYPLFVLESMALKKPVVVSDIAPLNEILSEGTGLKVSKGDAKSLSETIISLLSKRNLALSIGEKARTRVEQKFDIKKVAKEYDAFYRSLEGS